jgi:hypothetical protein
MQRKWRRSSATGPLQHVSVSEGGQAIVGNVTQAASKTASEKPANETPALTDARQAPMIKTKRVRRLRHSGTERMPSDHLRNTGPMLSSQRCGAKTRSGKPCKSPGVSGKRRCRMHGGAPGSGAPRGNKNALKHGRYTREALEARRQLRALLRQSRMLIQRVR